MKQENNIGKVWLVGAGPGDAGLFTIKGKRVLDQADVVVYDKLVGQGILGMIPKKAELIFVGKVSGNHAVPQHEINKILLAEALKGKKVVRLKGGDPFVFGRGGEELELLYENNIPFEIVPGITSAVSVPAYNGIPVTHRDFVSSLHIITGHTKKKEEAEIDYESLVKLGGTFVFLMGVSAMPKICKGLLEAGIESDMPAAVLERGTTAHQRRVVSDVTNLTKDAEKAGIKTPAIIVVGKVCALEKEFHWAEDRMLGGLKIAVTRPRSRNSKLADKLSMLGAEIVLMPTIETKEIENNKPLEEAINDIRRFDYIAFTSPVGVTGFFNKLYEMKKDIRELGSIKFAAIGSATKAAIEKRGIIVDLMPSVYTGKALGELIARDSVEWGSMIGRKPEILIPRAKIGTDEVIKPLEAASIKFADIAVYDTFEAGNENKKSECANDELSCNNNELRSKNSEFGRNDELGKNSELGKNAKFGKNDEFEKNSELGKNGEYEKNDEFGWLGYKNNEKQITHADLIDFESEEVDYVAFTSASTVRGFVTLSGLKDFSDIKAVCIGEKTAEEAGKYKMQCFVAKEATIDSMVECFLKLVDF